MKTYTVYEIAVALKISRGSIAEACQRIGIKSKYRTDGGAGAPHLWFTEEDKKKIIAYRKKRGLKVNA